VHNDGHLSGFHDGVKYIITLAENFLVEHEKLGSRKALRDGDYSMPTWWIATLVEAFFYEPAYTPLMAQKSAKTEQAEVNDGTGASAEDS
jgi:hypothetical protein